MISLLREVAGRISPMRGTVIALGVGAIFAVVPASALAAAPAWTIASAQYPTDFAPGAVGQYVLSLTNVGNGPTSGAVTVTDTLPAGLTASAASGTGWTCTIANPTVTCTSSAAVPAATAANPITVSVAVAADASGQLVNSATVSGGGATTASATDPTPVSAAVPGFGVSQFSTSVTDPTGADDTQAGDHPWLATTTIDFNTATDLITSAVLPSGDGVRDVVVDLPPGFVGNPQAVPTCPLSQLANSALGAACPAASKVGFVTLTTNITSETLGVSASGSFAVFSVAPPAGSPAAFAFNFLGRIVLLRASVVGSGSDAHLRITTSGVTQIGLSSIALSFYGTPASVNGSVGSPVQPFLTNPTDCSETPVTTLSVDSWADPGAVQTYTAQSPQVTGCDKLRFNPSVSVQPDTTQADAPAAYTVNLSVPQPDYNANPSALATPALRNATVTLPQGVAVSPAAAQGLQGCSDAQFDLASSDPASCPDASKIGTVTVQTPLLSDPLEGSVYLGTPQCDPCTDADASSGRMLRLFLEAQADGVVIKLPGTVSANPITGQLTATFDNNPQLPFSNLQLSFNTGPRAALVNSPTCGTATTTTDLTPWSGGSGGTADATPSDSFDVSFDGFGAACPAALPFSPALSAGTVSAAAGGSSAFTFRVTRDDRTQRVSQIDDVQLPPGLLAKIAGVPLCQPSDAAAGTCPAGSQIGSVTVGAGAGADPFYLTGKVFLTSGYEGGPYGLSIVVPAIAGPFDLGTVVVRGAIFVDPTTAALTVQTDPLPTILDGIPLDLRDIDLDMDRPGFMVDPTSCDPMQITANAVSTNGAVAPLSAGFQVHGCQDIGFSPKLAIALSGKGKTRSGDHPTLTATLSNPAGEANILSAKVALPLSLALDPDNSNHVCAFATAAAVHGGAVGCASSTIVGTATAVTPLLDQPLTGPVYLVQGLRCKVGQVSAQGRCANGQTAIRTLPSLLLPLRGQIALDLRAQTSVSGGKLVTTFASVPDAPVSQFTLQINGGPKGLLVVTGRGQSVCEKAQVGNGNFGAQSGKTMAQNMTLTTPCGKPAQLKVLSHKVEAGKLVLRVSTSERGKVTVTGNGLKSFGRTMGAGKHQLQVAVKPAKRTSKAGAKAKQHAKANAKVRHAGKPNAHAKQAKPKLKKVKVTVQVTPPNAKSAAKTFTVKM